MTWILFVIGVFAVYRCADILADEEGPMSIFTRLRRKVPAKTNAGRGVRCPYCLGVHLAAINAIAMWWMGYVPAELIILYCFGVAGAAAAIKSGIG